jgi:hypothetical protein
VALALVIVRWIVINGPKQRDDFLLLATLNVFDQGGGGRLLFRAVIAESLYFTN